MSRNKIVTKLLLGSLAAVLPANIQARDLEQASIQTDQKNISSNSESSIYEDKKAVTEISLGNKDSRERIEVYISPSCLHCAKFVIDDVEDFMKKNGENFSIILKFLPTTAKDIFIMKLIQHETKGEKPTYYEIYKKYMKRALATINHINPTKEQKDLYKGSNSDPEMIKFQVNASDFGFSDKKIVDAFPDPEMKAPYERTLMLAYSKGKKEITEIVHSNELDLPLIIRGGKQYKTLNEATNKN